MLEFLLLSKYEKVLDIFRKLFYKVCQNFYFEKIEENFLHKVCHNFLFWKKLKTFFFMKCTRNSVLRDYEKIFPFFIKCSRIFVLRKYKKNWGFYLIVKMLLYFEISVFK